MFCVLLYGMKLLRPRSKIAIDEESDTSGEGLYQQALAIPQNSDDKLVFSLYSKAAALGHGPAMNAVGVCYMLGLGVRRDVRKAAESFVKGAEVGDGRSLYNLGRAHQLGLGVALDHKGAFDLFTRAAEKGDADGTHALAQCYESGIGTTKSERKATEIFVKNAEENGHCPSFGAAGLCLLKLRDDKRALAMLQRGANEGDDMSMFGLAEIYLQGRAGVSKDESVAVAWLERAVKVNGLPEAEFSLGLCCAKGTGVVRDEARAAKHYKRAADKGHLRAVNACGICLLLGMGVEKNEKKAFEMFELASNRGDPNGIRNMGLCFSKGTGVKRDDRRAVDLYRRAAELGDVESMYFLGVYLETGRGGVAVDLAMAESLYRQAYEQFHGAAACALARLYESRDGLEKSLERSLKMFKQAYSWGCAAAAELYQERMNELVPDSIRRGGPDCVKAFISDMLQEGNVPWRRAKVMVLGRECVGKTQLYHCVRKGKYDENLSTDGIDVHRFSLLDLDLNWFDFGGQAVFYPTHQFFLTTQCIYVVVFRLDDPNFLSTVRYWLQILRNYSCDVPKPAKVVVLGTHADLVSKEQSALVWTMLESELNGQQHIVGHAAINCREDREIVVRMLETALTSANLGGSMQVPPFYEAVAVWVEQQRQTTPRMSFDEVLAVFAGVNERQLEQALGFLSDMGICVWNRKMRLLVLDPQWLAKTFAQLVSFSNSWVKSGTVLEANLGLIWKESSAGDIQETMQLFELHDLVFPLLEEGRWIVPSMLPRERPGLPLSWESGSVETRRFERMFKLGAIPLGLFGRLIARVKAWKESRLTQYWRDGLQVECGGEIADVTLDDQHNCIIVRVQAASRKRGATFGKHRGSGNRATPQVTTRLLIQRMGEEIAALLERVFDRATLDLSVKQFVTCPHCLGKSGGDPHRLDYDACVKLVLDRVPTFRCGPIDVAVSALGDDVTFGYVSVLNAAHIQLDMVPFASGGFGSIYRGMLRHGATHVAVAAKELKVDKVCDGFREFQHEVSLMSSLQHPNIVRLHGIMLNPLRMIIEFCSDGDLYHALVAKRITTEEQRLRIIYDIAAGMNVLHSCQPPLAHRDLRSPNVLLASLNPSVVCAKIADFGLTVRVTERMRSPMQTWQWMAPEAQVGDNYTESCDRYSYAMVVYEVYAGEVPFSEFTSTMRQIEVMQAARNEPHLRPTLPESVPLWTKKMVGRLWHRDPSFRPPFLECLRTITEESGVVDARPADLVSKEAFSEKRLRPLPSPPSKKK